MTRPAENRPLTAIRGVAALWVVGHHWLPAASVRLRWLFEPGFTAVDLFFVLSGLILAQVHRDLTAAGLPDFYLRRVFRLYPLHLVCLAWLVGLAVAQHGVAVVDWATLAASAALVQPFLAILPIANPPSWSIGVELGCYLAFPLLLASVRAARGWLAGGLVLALLWLEWRIQARLLGVTAGGGAMARGLCGFALGMAISVWGSALAGAAQRGRRGWWLATILECCGLAGIGYGLRSWHWDLIPPAAAVLLAGLQFDRGPVAALLRAAPWVWLGRISFSMYLVHFPLLTSALLLGDPTQLTRRGQWLWYDGLLAVLLAVSTLSWRWIEEPARRLPRRLVFRQGALPLDPTKA